MRHIVGIVIAFDHFLPRGLSPELYELHVVVQVEGESEHIRLRTHYGAPMRAVEFGAIATNENCEERLASAVEMFAVGSRLALVVADPLEEYRNPEKGHHQIDKIVDPRCIRAAPQKALQQKPSWKFQLILGGKG